MAPDDDHRCAWREEAEQLRSEVEELKQKFASLERRLLGPKSEKMPAMADEVRRARPAGPGEAQARRAENKRAREKLETEIVPVPVPAAERNCPKCGNDKLKPVGNGTPSVTYQYVAAHFRRRIYQRETLSCSCGKHIITAPCPDKLADRSPYSASFIAALIAHFGHRDHPIRVIAIGRYGSSRSERSDAFLESARQSCSSGWWREAG